MKIKIGTRASKLALAQTNIVVEELKKKFPNIETEIVHIVSKGDTITDRPLSEIGGDGVFAAEHELAIKTKKIDVAVHSAKDLPVKLADGLEIIGVTKRGNPRDVLVSKKNAVTDIGKFTIGTCSLRRRKISEKLFPNAEFMDIRGNIDTRISKLKNGYCDGIILAAAGLERLGIFDDKELSFTVFDTDKFIPAPCQGIIAVEGEKGVLNEIFDAVSDENTRYCLETEREFLRVLGGSCSDPTGAFSEVTGDKITLTVTLDGKKYFRLCANIADRFELAKEAVRKK